MTAEVYDRLTDQKFFPTTGNDLARVLRWGSGYTGTEDPLSLLRDVIDAEEIRLDRWTVVFHPEDKQDDPKELSKQLPGSFGKSPLISALLFPFFNQLLLEGL